MQNQLLAILQWTWRLLRICVERMRGKLVLHRFHADSSKSGSFGVSAVFESAWWCDVLAVACRRMGLGIPVPAPVVARVPIGSPPWLTDAGPFRPRFRFDD